MLTQADFLFEDAAEVIIANLPAHEARNENPPFPRGATGTWLSSGEPSGVTDTNRGQQWEGMEFLFEDKDWSKFETAGERSSRYVTCRCVRNVSGGALLPKRWVSYSISGTSGDYLPATGAYGGQVSGYGVQGTSTDLTGLRGGVVDEFLPTAGAANNDLFWIVTRGPSLVTTDVQGTTTLSVGHLVQPGLTADGRVIKFVSTAGFPNTGAAINAFLSVIGIAMQAVAANNTDFLCDVGAHLN